MIVPLRAHDPLDLLERIARFRQQVDDIARHDAAERVVRVVQVGNIRLLDEWYSGTVRGACLSIPSRPPVVATSWRHMLKDGCDRARAARTSEHGVTGESTGNGCPVAAHTARFAVLTTTS